MTPTLSPTPVSIAGSIVSKDDLFGPVKNGGWNMDKDGRSPGGAGLSPTVEPASSLDGFATSIPSATALILIAGVQARAVSYLETAAKHAAAAKKDSSTLFQGLAQAAVAEAGAMIKAAQATSAQTCVDTPKGAL